MENQENLENQKQKQNIETIKVEPNKRINKKRIITIALGVIAIILIGLLLSHFLGQRVEQVNTLDLDRNATIVDLNGQSKEEVQAILDEQVEDGMINISMNVNPVFSNGKSKGTLNIINNEVNKYPQVVEIYTEDTEELIYKSGLIPVGSTVATAPLMVNLPKGEYQCVAYFNAVKVEDNSFIGRAGAKVTLTIQN